MRDVLKDRRFWLCALLFAGLFCPALYFEHMDSPYHPAPYIWIFHTLIILSWLWGLYCRWSGRWKPGDGRIWGIWVLLLVVVFQLPMCGVSGVSWVLLGVSVVLGLTAIILSKR